MLIQERVKYREKTAKEKKKLLESTPNQMPSDQYKMLIIQVTRSYNIINVCVELIIKYEPT